MTDEFARAARNSTLVNELSLKLSYEMTYRKAGDDRAKVEALPYISPVLQVVAYAVKDSQPFIRL